MKKLYRYTKIQNKTDDVVFVSKETNQNLLLDEAQHYLEEQSKYYSRSEQDGTVRTNLVLIENSLEVPEEWRNAIYWGPNKKDLTVEQFFALQENAQEREEYENAKAKYFALKDKFEK